jgi:type IV secretion system protein VirD4
MMSKHQLAAAVLAPRGSRFLSDTSDCPSGYASSYFREVRRGEWEVRDVQNIADILVDPEGSLERRNHRENTRHALLVGAILHVLMPDRTRPWRRRGTPVRSEAPDRIDHGGHDDDAASGGGRSAPGHFANAGRPRWRGAARAVDASWLL